MYQKKFLDSIKNLKELKYLHIENRQFQITQDLIDTLSFLKGLKSFYIDTKLPMSHTILNFEPLQKVNRLD